MRVLIGCLLASAAMQGDAQARELHPNELDRYANVIRGQNLPCNNVSSGRYVGQNELGISFIIYCGNRAYRMLLTPDNRWIVYPQ